MNTTDKNYVDRLHNQQVNELNERGCVKIGAASFYKVP